MLRGLFLFGTLCWVHALLAQKTLTAIKSQASPVIDGKLDDAIWQAAPVATNFIQTFPSSVFLLQQKRTFVSCTTTMLFISVPTSTMILL